MKTSSPLGVFACGALACFAVGCSSAGGVEDPTSGPASHELVGADDCGSSVGSLVVGSTLVATADVNLRAGPSSSDAILHVVPKGSKVTVVGSMASNGYYDIEHNGVVGWSGACFVQSADTTTPDAGTAVDSGAGVDASVAKDSGTVGGADASTGGDAGTGGVSAVRTAAIARAKPAVGFSYWWGHGAWLSSGPTSSKIGACTGSCPSCTHSGSYGADCSGYVAKIWQVPASNTDVALDSHPYSTADFVVDASQWHTIDRGAVQPGDAFVYHTGGEGHIFLYESGDGWGSMWSYEAKGCSYGITHDLRTATSAYHAIAHY